MPSDCANYFKTACANWRIGAWLPSLADGGFEPSQEHHATKVGFDDGFVYEGRIPRGKGWAQMQGAPADGTFFVYGMAGPPRGAVVYDRAAATVYYSQGCCAWHGTVLAASAGPRDRWERDSAAGSGL